MSDTTFNGWSNRATWCVNLWLTNEQPEYRMLQIIVRFDETIEERATRLETYVYRHYAVPTTGLLADLLPMDSVNWEEIIRHHRED